MEENKLITIINTNGTHRTIRERIWVRWKNQPDKSGDTFAGGWMEANDEILKDNDVVKLTELIKAKTEAIHEKKPLEQLDEKVALAVVNENETVDVNDPYSSIEIEVEPLKKENNVNNSNTKPARKVQSRAKKR